MTWRDDVAAVDEAVRAGWEILDGFRSIAFTGAVRFALLPTASVYLERGRIYYAERESDPDVADRLVAAGGLRPSDLASGVIVLGAEGGRGAIDHLGHLFERVPSLDRQRVMLALELVTEETLSWIAGQSVSSTSTEPYVYHPSGVHRWYEPTVPAAPAFVPPTTRPVDRQHSPVDLPRVRIAWPSPPPPPPPASPEAASAAPIDTTADPAPAAPAAPASEVHDSRADASAPSRRWRTPEMAPRDVPGDEPDPLEDFTVVWPSGDLDDDERDHEVVAAHAPVVAFDRFDDPHEPPDELDIVIRGDVDADTTEVGIAVRQAIASVRTDAAQPRRPTPVPLAAEGGNHQRRTETETERHDGDRGAEPDDDPFTRDRPPSRTEGQTSIDERRTALQRLIDAMRGR